MSAVLGTVAKWAIPVGLAVGAAQSAMYDGKSRVVTELSFLIVFKVSSLMLLVKALTF
ncbi:unnamed protein product [Rhizopus microsporus]